MARWRSDDSAIPERLCRFVAGEWPGPDPVRQWKRAALDWLEAHPGRRLPFGEHGDPVDVIREAARLLADHRG